MGGTGGNASFALTGAPRTVGELGVVLSSPKNDSRFFSVPNMPSLGFVDPRDVDAVCTGPAGPVGAAEDAAVGVDAMAPSGSDVALVPGLSISAFGTFCEV